MRIDPDPWLAVVFGHEAFRVSLPGDGADTAALEAHARGRGGRAFYYAKVPAARVAQLQALTAAGLRVVDVNVTLERGRCAGPCAEGAAPVRDARPADRDALLGLASSCFVYSRFHLDPQVPPGVADAVKRAWVGN